MKIMRKHSAKFVVLIALSVMLALGSCGNSPESRLKEIIEESNKECPASIDHITTLLEIKEDGNFVTYVCQIDEKLLDMTEMQQQRAVYEQNIRNTVARQLTDPQSANGPFFLTVMEAGKGLRHHYVGKDSRKTLDIDLTCEQLQQMAQPATK